MIDFGKSIEAPTRALIRELLELISEEVDELGTRTYIAPIERMLQNGTSADRQLRCLCRYRRSQSRCRSFDC